jgi:hypothetical protein
VSFRGTLDKYKKKLYVYKYHVNGTFDYRNKKRLQPLTRIRKDEKEIEREESGERKLEIEDWYKDIDRNYYK